MNIVDNFTQDSDERLDYDFDWTAFLQSGETIASYVVEVSTGLTLHTSSATDEHVIAWLSGGTVGSAYFATCRITTNSVPARIAEASMGLQVI